MEGRMPTCVHNNPINTCPNRDPGMYCHMGVIDGRDPVMMEHLCIQDLRVHPGPVEDCCIDLWRDHGIQP